MNDAPRTLKALHGGMEGWSDDGRHRREVLKRSSGSARSRDNNPAVAAIRCKEIRRLLTFRYGPELPNDDAGREDLDLLLAHLAHLRCAESRMRNAIEVLAPWAISEADELISDRLQQPPPFYKADDLAARLGLVMQERTRLAITTIGAIDCDREMRLALRRERRRRREAERRRRQRLLSKRVNEHKLASLSARASCVLRILSPSQWSTVALITTAVGHLPEFQAGYRPLQGDSLNKAVRRAVAELRDKGLATWEGPIAKFQAGRLKSASG